MHFPSGSRTAALAVVAASALALAMATPAHAAAGDVATFGANPFGQLANGEVGSTARPTPVGVLVGATDVAGGREHALAVVSGGVYAWGADTKGAVGDGGVYEVAVNTPRRVGATVLSGIDSVTTGHYHSMALDTEAAAVWAWGWNSRGQTGPGGGTSLKTGAPVRVTGLTGDVSMIAAGRAHSLALVGGQVYAWGDNGAGQLGSTADIARHSTPTLVAGLPAGVTWIAGGRDSSFAIAGGVLYAWGSNNYGQLGIGSVSTSVPTPTRVPGAFSQVESGADHTVALTTGGTVSSWGRNRYGQLGYAGSANRTAPVPVPGLSGVTQVRVGRDHSTALTVGSYYTWGRNDGGQLGLSPTATPSTSTPTAIADLAGVRDAGGGQVYSVVLR